MVPVKGMPIYTYSIRMPAGEDAIGIGETALEAQKDLVTFFIDRFATEGYKRIYYRAI